MIDVFFGESRTYIKDTLMQKLGWKRGEGVFWYSVPEGVFRVMTWDSNRVNPKERTFRIKERDGKYCFGLAIPGVSRGRLNGARGVVGKVEGDELVIDVRELLAPHNP